MTTEPKQYAYRTNRADLAIERIEVVKETPATITVRGKDGKAKRESKTNSFHRFHPTYEAARTHLVERAERMLAAKREQLAQYELAVTEARSLPARDPQA